MRCAAELVLASLPALVREEDPGRPLAALPRQLERKDEPSAPLHEAIWERILDVPFLASAAGRLHRPAELRRPPVDEPELQSRWMRVAADAVADRYVHPTCFATPVRSARQGQLAAQIPGQFVRGTWSEIDSLRDMPRLRKDPGFHEWLGSVASPDPGIGREVILLAAEALEKRPDLLHELRDLAIVPTADGRLAEPARCAFPGVAAERAGLEVIHPALAGDEEVRAAVQKFGVDAADDDAWRRALEQAWPAESEPPEPEKGWELCQAAPEAILADFFATKRQRLRFKTSDGNWRPAEEVLRIGNLIGEDECEANAAVAIDGGFAERYAPFLDQLGIGDLPRD